MAEPTSNRQPRSTPEVSEMSEGSRHLKEVAQEKADQAGRTFSNMRSSAGRMLQERARELGNLTKRSADYVSERSQATASNIDQRVRSRPWTALGITAFASMLIGMMMARRK